MFKRRRVQTGKTEISLSKSSWSRRILRAMLLLFFGLVIPLVIVEISMTVFEPYLFNDFFEYDPDIGYRVRPNTAGSNQFGFLDKDYPVQRVPGTFRILVLGDSFGWAGGKDGNYTALLEEKLNAPNKTPVEVINTSCPMTHTGEQLIMLKKFGLQFQPDLVVLGFFTGNDFIDADPNRKRIVVNGTYIDIDKRHEHTLFGYPIVRRSRLYLFLRQKLTVFREQLRNRSADQKAEPPGSFSVDTFLSIEKERMEFCNVKTRGKYAPNVEFIFQSLREMRDLLKARGIPLFVAIFPDQFQVEDQLSDAVFNKFNLDRNDYDLFWMQKLLKPFLESEKIPYVDMLERFREAGKQESLYLSRDTHWNSAGNHLAATILEEQLAHVMQDRSNTGATTIP